MQHKSPKKDYVSGGEDWTQDMGEMKVVIC